MCFYYIVDILMILYVVSSSADKSIRIWQRSLEGTVMLFCVLCVVQV